jgi:hypothetical protein
MCCGALHNTICDGNCSEKKGNGMLKMTGAQKRGGNISVMPFWLSNGKECYLCCREAAKQAILYLLSLPSALSFRVGFDFSALRMVVANVELLLVKTTDTLNLGSLKEQLEIFSKKCGLKSFCHRHPRSTW